MTTTVAAPALRSTGGYRRVAAFDGGLEDPLTDTLSDPLVRAPPGGRASAVAQRTVEESPEEQAPTREEPARFEVDGEAHALWAEGDGELWVASRPVPIEEALTTLETRIATDAPRHDDGWADEGRRQIAAVRVLIRDWAPADGVHPLLTAMRQLMAAYPLVQNPQWMEPHAAAAPALLEALLTRVSPDSAIHMVSPYWARARPTFTADLVAARGLAAAVDLLIPLYERVTTAYASGMHFFQGGDLDDAPFLEALAGMRQETMKGLADAAPGLDAREVRRVFARFGSGTAMGTAVAAFGGRTVIDEATKRGPGAGEDEVGPLLHRGGEAADALGEPLVEALLARMPLRLIEGLLTSAWWGADHDARVANVQGAFAAVGAEGIERIQTCMERLGDPDYLEAIAFDDHARRDRACQPDPGRIGYWREADQTLNGRAIAHMVETKGLQWVNAVTSAVLARGALAEGVDPGNRILAVTGPVVLRPLAGPAVTLPLGTLVAAQDLGTHLWLQVTSGTSRGAKGQAATGARPFLTQDLRPVHAQGAETMGTERGATGGLSDAQVMPAAGAAFPRAPSPDDVKQGDLGDCYLLSPLISLASRKPDRVRALITPGGDLGPGSWTVHFRSWVDDETLVTRDITVPNSFPVRRWNGLGGNLGLIYALRGKDPSDRALAMWPAIVEKAWAVARTADPVELGDPNSPQASYAVTEAGTGRDFAHGGLGTLTTSFTPAELRDVAKRREFYAAFHKHGYGTLGVSGAGAGKQWETGVDVSASHEYAIVGYKKRAGTIDVRNPHGREHPGVLHLDRLPSWVESLTVEEP